MKLINFVLRSYRWSVIAIVLISLCSGGINIALIGLINRQLSPTAEPGVGFVGSFAALVSLTIALDILVRSLLSSLTGRTSYQLQMNLARQILLTPLSRLEAHGAPRLLAILIDDVRSITQLLGNLPALCIGAATIIGSLVYLTWLSPIALAALTVLALPTILGYRLIQRKARVLTRQFLSERDGIFDLLRTLVDGVKELQLHARRRYAFVQQVLEIAAASFTATGIAARHWHQLAGTWSQSFYFIFVAAIFLLSRWRSLPPEVMTGYALILLYLKSSMASVLNAAPLWSDANVAIQRIEHDGFELFGVEPAVEPFAVSDKSADAVPPIELVLHEIVYHYRNDKEDAGFTLGPLSLTLRAGELIFVKGGNGSGKTTLIKLLTGLYTPDSGTIHWDGMPIGGDNIEAYRQNFTAIFAEPFLFERLLGVQQVNLDQQAQIYLTRLQLDRKVRVKDGHLSTLDLSHGQRKRLALLTAWLEDRPVYIFDEWAAGQDPEFRDMFYQQFLPQLKARGKLVIVISHDESYYSGADRLIELDLGRVRAGRTTTTMTADWDIGVARQ